MEALYYTHESLIMRGEELKRETFQTASGPVGLVVVMVVGTKSWKTHQHWYCVHIFIPKKMRQLIKIQDQGKYKL